MRRPAFIRMLTGEQLRQADSSDLDLITPEGQAMKAVWYERQGAARDVLRYGELPTPSPAAGEVRVRLHASAVNPADANRRAGRLHDMEFPLIIPNSDGAGVIDDVGDGVAPIARRTARLALLRPTRAAVRHGGGIHLPARRTHRAFAGRRTSYFEGACLGIPAMTAHARAVR